MQWATNLCRICGHESETCHQIYEKNGDDLENKLKMCLNLNVHKNDQKPKKLCNDCLFKVIDFSEFIQMCILTNERFEQLLIRPEWPSEHAILEQKTTVIVAPKNVTDSPLCVPEIELYKATMLPPIEGCSPINDQEIINIVEDSSFVECTDYPREYQNDFYNSNVAANDPRLFQLSSTSSTTDLSYIEKPRYENDHYSSYNYNKNNSSVVSNYSSCSNTCIDYTNYNNSTEKAVTNNANIGETIPLNKETSATNTSAVNSDHQKNYDLISSYKVKVKKTQKMFHCSQCDKKFQRCSSLNVHIATHTNIKPYKCDNCSKSFAIKSDLSSHRKIHTDCYRCKDCLKSFSVPSKLERHLRTHTNQRPYVCSFKNCGRAFSDKRNLDGHMVSHSEVRGFKCGECDRSFKTDSQLKVHRKAHSDEKLYVCEDCGKSYKWNTNLLNHKMKHLGYVCSICETNCGSLAKFKKHGKECKKNVIHLPICPKKVDQLGYA